MTTYKDIRGTHITTVASDPPAPVSGQMWYNSTTQVMKGFTSSPAGTFSSGGSMNTSRYYHAGYGASNDAAFAVSGQTSPGGPNTNTETYNGSSWTEVANLNTARAQHSGAGTVTSSLIFGGVAPPPASTSDTEVYNGSSWTEVANINNQVRLHGSAGASSTSALKFGGSTPNPSVDSGTTETWNGSSWTETTDLNSARSFLLGGAVGIQTAALAIAGYAYSPPSGNRTLTEIWNGSTWTESGDTSTGGTGRFGLYDNAVKVTGTTCETWNGSTWSSGTNASDNITSRSGGGTASSGMVFGGEPPGDGNSLTTSEEYISPTTNTVTFTAS